MTVFKIKEQIYNIPLLIIIGTWEDRAEYLYKKYNIKKVEQDCYGGLSETFSGDGDTISCAWLPEFDINNIEDIVILSHEIDHSAMHIMDLMSIPLLVNSANHAYIYLKEYFFLQALKKLKAVKNG